MAPAPRSYGVPLDREAALERAAQISALSDPTRVNLLRSISESSSNGVDIEHLKATTKLDQQLIEATVTHLKRAGLVDIDQFQRIYLSADALMRFGSLLMVNDDVASREPHLQATTFADELPSPIQRIANELADRFSNVFARETVLRYVSESYYLLASRTKVRMHLPVLTSRFAADRLSALATSRGLTVSKVPEVLFVCVQNAGRSQIASAVLRHIAGNRVRVRTAGSRPASRIDPIIIETLEEIGIPMPIEFPKPLTDEVVQASDYVITMGCGDACPVYPGRRYMDWKLDDPIGMPAAEVRRVRDEIVSYVNSLIEELLPSSSGSSSLITR